jgi:CheY-like chemotaxis protein/curved DNA-binding protein CbpA
MPHRILVVDDEEAIRALLKDFLEAKGYSVVVANDGEQGLKALREEPRPQLAIIDFLLPRKNGFALAESIRNDGTSGQLPLIMMSGVFKNPKTAVEAREKYQVVDFLAKPIDLERLLDLIRSSLEGVADAAPAPKPKRNNTSLAGGGSSVADALAQVEAEEDAGVMGASYPAPEPRGSSRAAAPAPSSPKRASVSASSSEPRRSGRPFPPLPEQGDLTQTPVALLLSTARYDKLTGQLDLSDQGTHRRIYILRGQPIFMQSNAEGENVAALLLQRGRITEMDFERCVQFTKTKKSTMQKALLELRLATETDLATAYKLLAGKLLPPAIGMAAGNFKWREGDAFVGRVPEGNFDAVTVLFEVIKKHVGPPQILTFFRGREDLPLQKTEEFDALLPYFKRIFGNGSVATGLGPRTTYRDLTKASKTQDAAAQTFAMAVSGMCWVDKLSEDNAMDVAVAAAAAEIARMDDNAASDPGPLDAPLGEASAAPEELDESQYTPEEKRARQRVQKAYREYGAKDFFTIFGLEKAPLLDEQKLKDAYFALAKQWHSDAFSGLRLGAVQTQQEELFKRITEAYETLTDKNKRGEYLVFLDRQAKGLPTDINQIMMAEQVFDQGIALLRKRDIAGAKLQFKKAVEMNASEALYLAHLGWCTYQAEPNSQSALMDAVNLLKKAVSMQENLPSAYQFLGQICQSRNQLGEAKRWYERCLEFEPNNIEASRALRLMASRDEKDKAAKSGLLGRFLKK